ncbi:MAG: hypothetical protein HKM04_01690 [Legionellales bacterium]|nr:hypothetical protein [Legionellales bacterium]
MTKEENTTETYQIICQIFDQDQPAASTEIALCTHEVAYDPAQNKDEVIKLLHEHLFKLINSNNHSYGSFNLNNSRFIEVSSYNEKNVLYINFLIHIKFYKIISRSLDGKPLFNEEVRRKIDNVFNKNTHDDTAIEISADTVLNENSSQILPAQLKNEEEDLKEEIIDNIEKNYFHLVPADTTKTEENMTVNLLPSKKIAGKNKKINHHLSKPELNFENIQKFIQKVIELKKADLPNPRDENVLVDLMLHEKPQTFYQLYFRYNLYLENATKNKLQKLKTMIKLQCSYIYFFREEIENKLWDWDKEFASLLEVKFSDKSILSIQLSFEAVIDHFLCKTDRALGMQENYASNIFDINIFFEPLIEPASISKQIFLAIQLTARFRMSGKKDDEEIENTFQQLYSQASQFIKKQIQLRFLFCFNLQNQRVLENLKVEYKAKGKFEDMFFLPKDAEQKIWSFDEGLNEILTSKFTKAGSKIVILPLLDVINYFLIKIAMSLGNIAKAKKLQFEISDPILISIVQKWINPLDVVTIQTSTAPLSDIQLNLQKAIFFYLNQRINDSVVILEKMSEDLEISEKTAFTFSYDDMGKKIWDEDVDGILGAALTDNNPVIEYSFFNLLNYLLIRAYCQQSQYKNVSQILSYSSQESIFFQPAIKYISNFFDNDNVNDAVKTSSGHTKKRKREPEEHDGEFTKNWRKM